LGRGERFPHLLGRGGDVDGVDRHGFEFFGLEFFDIHHAACLPIDFHFYSTPSMPSALRGIVRALPDSRRLLRLERIAGHPFEMPSSSLLSFANPSWISVSFTNSPCGSSVKTTLVAPSFRISSSRSCLNV